MGDAVKVVAPQGLAPCPFCGSDRLDFETNFGGAPDPAVSVWCRDCCCEGPVSFEGSKVQAASMWNDRAPP